ncbi:helix-turn-helix domain-containing protein [Paenibacillus sp. HN-1]|uniref:helix-turn-helix transcriptional regulator n=1 Tax=Paenibacillus TaxID=44249 RepID=UPI001CA9AE1B|nr:MULTISPECIES: helix-turn-helix transcriptional regulator [Paenibacillus]MBY9078674.1 helix-turn-helix domain-containing protein [Paenibacillus sp. CGMCC 1.18879]MBY9084210.1 helix-turn-helix domain-containing protein [Paenibacillus sinensis]
MNDQARLEALSAFLKAQRAKITPASAGLPAGGRRRTPGLRREEVAQLAGVSTTWYTWLEQGRDIKASSSVLENIAKALRLTADERRYLQSLALESHVSPPAPPEEQPEIRPALLKIIRELKYSPAIVIDRRSRIVGWNDAARHVFLDFVQVPAEGRNLIELLFARKELQRLAVNWEDFVTGFLAIFRTYYGQYVEDEWYRDFLRHMSGQYPDFDRLWQRSTVNSAPDVLIEFRHAKAGKMLFELTSMQVHGSADLRCLIYTPSSERTELKLMKIIREA